jgi:hypothetical protein
MNTNYVAMVNHDWDKLLVTRFIVRMEETTSLSPMVVVSKKMES